MHLLLAHLAHLNRQIIPFRPTLCSTQAPYRLFWDILMLYSRCQMLPLLPVPSALPTSSRDHANNCMSRQELAAVRFRR